MISYDILDENWEGRVGRRAWEVTEAGKFGRLGRSRGLIRYGGRKFFEVSEVENIFGQVGRQIYEVREGEKFWMLGGQKIWEIQEVWNGFEGRIIGKTLSPVILVFLFAASCRLCKIS
jgi:hypothetical protein